MSHANNLDQFNGLEIAIIGMAGRFPGARNVEQFWQNLHDGVESITFFTDEELKAASVGEDALNNPNYIKARGLLDDVELFDASFFGIPAREAELMDPQHRHFLECAWEALEHAGYSAETFKGAIGLFAGNGMNAYLRNIFSNEQLLQSVGVMLTGMGAEKDHLTTRVAYKLGLRGPAITVQTSCSTSLVAIALACQSLLSGACDIALAGGVTISVPQREGYWYQEGGIHSPDGHCRAFDAMAQGTVSSNGAGIVVLKRLADALADGDTIHAIIKGSAVNNDGSLKVGYTAPGLDGQAAVIRAAQITAEVEPETITYVETHGTATALGDPIEVAALTRAFRARTDKQNFCAIGSLKSNIGHLDTAAGVAALIKTVLALSHRQLPPSLHFEQPNPQIDFATSPFFVNAELREWAATLTPRRAGVSSFGIGGTNAHLIVEEAPVSAPAAEELARPLHLLLLSARSSAALDTATTALGTHLEAHPEQSLADVAYTLQVGRKAFTHRRMLVSASAQDAHSALSARDPQRLWTGQSTGRRRAVSFLFPGQGTQYVGMGRELYESEEVFRAEFDRCREYLQRETGIDLREVLFGSNDSNKSNASNGNNGAAGRATALLKRTEVTQPALFVVEYALAQMWRGWGVEPEGMLGHSVGEYVAACVAGVMTVEEALRLVAARGRLMAGQPGGAMLAVGLGEAEVLRRLNGSGNGGKGSNGGSGGGLWLAAVNGDESCVVSGEAEAVARWERELVSEGMMSRRLETSHAFHSGMMDSVLAAFGKEVGKVRLQEPKMAYVSNVTGHWITAGEATDPQYWVRHLRHTVRFGDGLSVLLKQSDTILLEVGPGKTLGGLARRHSNVGAARISLPSLPEARQSFVPSSESALATTLQTLGRLWMAGVDINWEGFNQQERRRRVPLPTYPFERQRYWIEAQGRSAKKPESTPGAGRLKDIADWFYVPVWKQSVSPRSIGNGVLRVEMGAVWVVLLDECDLGEAVARRVEAAGQNVVRVKQGARFERLNEDVYAVNPSAPEDYQTLLRDIHQQGKKIGKIMHLWSVTGATQKVDPAQAQESGFYSLLLLAQALGEQRFAAAALTSDTADALDIAVVSDHMQEVTGEDLLYPDKATLLGACGAIPKEYPNINCRSIDVTLPQTEAATDHLAGQLVAEIVTKTLEEAVAYRGDIRWVQGFERVRLEAGPDPPARLRENGLYLITGGTGGIGLTLAHYLAQTVHARLVLIGRTPFPVREEWVEWLETHQADDPLSVKIRKLQAIEETGAEVLVLSADVSQESAMRAALEEARQRFGQFDGVIHAAGVPPRTLIQRTTPEMAAQVLAPKVEGTRILSQLLRDDRLDFMVLCSSHRSFLPDAGTADYSGANAFLDAFARRHNRVGGSLCISINWDGWLEVGMSGLSQPAGDASSPTNDESLRPGILPHEGVVAFSRILGSTLSQVAVAALDLPAVINYNRTFTAAIYWKNLNEANQSKTTYARPETADPYVAPQTDVEQALVEIWQDLLGIAPIGIHDNFFELGGDSVIGLQIIAKANQAGLGLTPGQVFEYQTVAELGAVSGIAPVLRAEQGAVTGPAPLTPIQHWFFEQDEPDPHHWNQSFLMELTENLEPALLERAVRHLLEHHDAVRARFTPGESGWQQTFAAPEESVPFTFFDLSTTPAAEQAHSIEREASALQASLNLSDGPVIRVALFRLGTDRPGRLLIIAHHLVVDNLSWRFLLEDLFTAYRQLKRAQSVELPLKTTSFQYWSQRLADYSQSEQLKRETAYWLSDAQADISPLPVDHPGGVNTVASAQRVLVELSLEETQQLLRDVPKVYNTQINDVLLAALVQAFAGWTGEHALLVGMEGHGREPIFQEVDFTRTVGWFTNLFPAHLRHEAAASPGEALKSVKEQLRRIPNRGIGYGLLRYLSDDAEIVEALKLMPQAEIVFLYQGQQDQKSTEPVGFRPASENNGLNQSPRGLRSHLFEIGGHVVGSQLRISWAYSENLHERSTVERLAESYIEALRSIITHAVSVEAGAYAAADFPEAGLSQQDLDDIIAELSEFED